MFESVVSRQYYSLLQYSVQRSRTALPSKNRQFLMSDCGWFLLALIGEDLEQVEDLLVVAPGHTVINLITFLLDPGCPDCLRAFSVFCG